MGAGVVSIGGNRLEAEPVVTDYSIEEVREILARGREISLLRFSTAGSVDDGKSTLIGRLLHDSHNIYEDHLDSLKGKGQTEETGFDLAYVTDGLRAEREQGITIDVAYRYFSTPRRRFILADTPGHEQYTRNMATGSSTADLTIVLIDARKGVLTQTKRHAFVASLLGVPRLVIAVNKMDLVQYSEETFENIRRDFLDFARKLDTRHLKFIPLSALKGDNVVTPSKNMPWYQGESLLRYLEEVYVAGDQNQVDFRFPVQCVIRPNQNYRGYAGQVRSGAIDQGDEIVVLPSMQKSRVRSIDRWGLGEQPQSMKRASSAMSVTLTLEDEVDISRGDMIVRSNNLPKTSNRFEAIMVWMNESAMDLKKQYIIRHTSRETAGIIDNIHYKIDVNTLHRVSAGPLELNEIGRLSIVAKKPLFLDAYRANRGTGNLVFIDPDTFLTVGAGVVVEKGLDQHEPTDTPTREKSADLHVEHSLLTRAEREARFGSRARTYWCTGLSGSGKSTLARQLEQSLFLSGKAVYRLDGDNLRMGLTRDLGFSQKDRSENIRRVAEVAKLFNDAGISVICSLISPYAEERRFARETIGEGSFIEIYVSTPLEVCEGRDTHGLYKKARAGELKGFTGISAPYEVPESPEITIDTSTLDVQTCVDRILAYTSAHDSE